MKKVFLILRNWLARIFADSFSKALVNILTISITALLTFLLTIGISLISHGLHEKIEVPIYLLLVIILISIFGLIVIIEKILLLIDFQLKDKGLRKIVIINDAKSDSREWRVVCKQENKEWEVEKKELYCNIHNLKLLFSEKYFGDSWVPDMVSICSDCKNKMVIHCSAADKKYYLSDINNRAIRKAIEES